MKTVRCMLAVTAVAQASSTAGALEFRNRFVERVGNIDLPIAGNHLVIGSREVKRIRVQLGVFDDANGAAPQGGIRGWSLGTLAVSGSGDLASETRTPGRLAPFNFPRGANSNGNPPLPDGDPFNLLTEIDAAMGTQSPIWQCEPDGSVPDQPPAVVRGLNTFVSFFEFTITPMAEGVYTIAASGNLLSATEWLLIGTPMPPECGDPADPSDDIAGNLLYAPVPAPLQSFSSVLTVEIPVPAPGAGPLLGLGVVALTRRRRSRAMK